MIASSKEQLSRLAAARRRSTVRRGAVLRYRRLEVEALENRLTLSGIEVVGLGPGGPPEVYVLDSQTHQVLQQFSAYNPSFTGGVHVALADLTGNGVPDIVTAPGAGGGPDIKVFDSSTGTLLREFFAFNPSFAGGVSVATGDVNGDGIPDILVGAGAGGGPEVKVFSGTDNSVLDDFMAYDPGFAGGVAVAAGDLSDAGHDDIVTGAGAGGGPNVRIFDGASAALIDSYMAYDPSFNGGVSVAAANLENQGTVQIITGAGAGGGPQVNVFDGLSNTPVGSFFAFAPAFVGGVQVSTDDLVPGLAGDILVGAGPGGGPAVATFDPRTFTQTSAFFVGSPGFSGGVFAAGSTAGPLPAALTRVLYVASTADCGINTLRAAIQNADADTSTDRLVIDFSGLDASSGAQLINLLSALPAITRDNIVVDGTTVHGFAAAPLVELNGAAIPHPPLVVDGKYTPSDEYNSNGLLVRSSSVAVQGLVLSNFPGNGLVFVEGADNQVFDVYCGTDASGTMAQPNIIDGIYLTNNANHDTIGGAQTLNRAATGDPSTPATSVNGRNVFSGNGIATPVSIYTPAGIEIWGTGTSDNIVSNNFFGPDATGTTAIPNLYAGVFIHGGASNNSVDDSSGAGNVISGNGSSAATIITGGVILDQLGTTQGTFTSQNSIRNNLIGLNQALAPLGNLSSGVALFQGATSNSILGNTIAANAADGVLIADTGTQNNLVLGNYIGTDSSLSAGLGNKGYGVSLAAGASGNTIGGSQLLTNTATGNTSNSNLKVGNFIWTNTVGQVDLAGSASSGPADNGNAILDNSLFGSAIGITNGTTANNGLQAPTLTAVTATGGSTTITGSFTGIPSTPYQVQIFAAPATQAATGALAEFFLTQFTVTTNAAGQGNIDQVVTGLTIGPNPTWLVATVTDPNNNSSPLSSAVKSG